MNADKWKIHLLLALLALVSSFGQSQVLAASEVELYFDSEVEIDSTRIYLGEIARITGEGQLIAELAQIDLGPAPLPGGSFSLGRELILSGLAYRGYDLQQMKVSGLESSGVVVKRAYQILEQERVMTEIYAYLHKQFADSSGELEINLRKDVPAVKLPLGDYQVIVATTSGSRLLGRITVPVTILLDGQKYNKIPINLEVKLFAKVFVTTKTVNRLSNLTADLIEERQQEITELSGELVDSLDQVIGKQARRTLEKGTILVQKDLLEPILIKRNDQITIIASFGGVQVQATGKALDSGAKGDWIWVENSSSGQKIKVQIVDVGIVQVLVN